MLYLVALIRQPSKKEADEGKTEELVMAPTPILAPNEQSAAVQAVIKNKDTLGDMTNVQVIARPF